MTRPRRRGGEFALPARARPRLELCRPRYACAGRMHRQHLSWQFGCRGERESTCPDRAGNRRRVQAFRDKRPVGSSPSR